MDKKTINIVCFAGLRKYFGNETTIFVESGARYSNVIDELKAIKPDAAEVLSSCRIAVNENFVKLTDTLDTETLFLIPPSSGG